MALVNEWEKEARRRQLTLHKGMVISSWQTNHVKDKEGQAGSTKHIN